MGCSGPALHLRKYLNVWKHLFSNKLWWISHWLVTANKTFVKEKFWYIIFHLLKTYGCSKNRAPRSFSSNQWAASYISLGVLEHLGGGAVGVHAFRSGQLRLVGLRRKLSEIGKCEITQILVFSLQTIYLSGLMPCRFVLGA